MGLRPQHLLILLLVVILLFGARKLPDLARSLGRSMRIMKAETRGLVDEPEPDDLDEKAEAKSGRKPLAKEQPSEAQTGEVLDPPADRVRDN